MLAVRQRGGRVDLFKTITASIVRDNGAHAHMAIWRAAWPMALDGGKRRRHDAAANDKILG